jgi:hypothetical protein
MEVIQVKNPAIRQVLKQVEVARMGSIVPNVELVIVHIARFLTAPLKETAAGEGVTLFGMEIRPFLAVFQTTISH